MSFIMVFLSGLYNDEKGLLKCNSRPFWLLQATVPNSTAIHTSNPSGGHT